MPASVRLGDVCSGHGCFPSRPNDQGSPNIFVNDIPVHRVTDHWATHCLVGSTKVRMLSGGYKTMEELSQSFEGEYVYSCTEDGTIVPGKIVDAFVSGWTRTIVRVHLDNDKVFECSTDHLVMMRDGSYLEAQYLEQGSSLMPLYRRLGKHQYEEVWDNYTGAWIKTHKMSALANTKQHQRALECIGERGNKYLVVHHKNFKRLDNRPTNLRWMGVRDHFRWHSKHGHNIWLNMSSEKRAALKKVRSKIAKRVARKLLQEGVHNFQIDHPMLREENKRKISESNDRRRLEGNFNCIKNNPMKDPRTRAKVSSTNRKRWSCMSLEEKERHAQRTRNQWANMTSEEYEDLRKKFSRIVQKRVESGEHHFCTSNPMQSEEGKLAMGRSKIIRIYKAIRELGLGFNERNYKKLYIPSSPGWNKLKNYFKNLADLEKQAYHNHKVDRVEIVRLRKKVPLYDLTIQNREATHNFALSCGIFVHNCCPPPCHDSVAATGSPNVFANDLPRCRVGDLVACGSTMVQGSPNVFIND